MEQRDFNFEIPTTWGTEPNPCVRVFGAGPDGATCKGCALLYIKHNNSNRRYYGCRLRTRTAGPATDHLVGWRACAKYEPEP